MINCLGVKLGSRMQSVLMLLKIAAIAGLIGAGIVPGAFATSSAASGARPPAIAGLADGRRAPPWCRCYLLLADGRPPTSSPRKLKTRGSNLSRALVLGVAGVIVLYVGVNFVCVRTLGPQGLADTRVPATAVMRVAMGDSGAPLIALGITVSTLGFLSQSVLTAPRVYFAMARDGLFFRERGQSHEAHACAGTGHCSAECRGRS